MPLVHQLIDGQPDRRPRIALMLQYGYRWLHPVDAPATDLPVEGRRTGAGVDRTRISDNGWNVYNSTSTTGATNARER
ncbi:hypothetical protein ACFVW1_36285 [Streptomyces olivochromogenes]|uniref:hypothetical protein n=1 Tax=Streptomyces olivochromogenes TaxID=1963 RepID=UPI0036D940D3